MSHSYGIKLKKQPSHYGVDRWIPEPEKNPRKPTNLIARFLSNFDNNETFTEKKLTLINDLHVALLQEAKKIGEHTLDGEDLKRSAMIFNLECANEPFSLDEIKGENKPTEEDWHTRMKEIAYKYDL